MSKLSLLVILQALVLLIASCNRTTVSLRSSNAKGEVRPLQNFVFQFDKALVPDSLLNDWDSTQYIQFEPEIAGRFRWRNSDELVFSPSSPLPPATSFTAKINDDVLQFSNFGKIDHDKINFYTPELEFEQSLVRWVLQGGNTGKPVPEVELFFNFPVDPKMLEGKMKLTVDGVESNYRVLTISPDARITLQLDRVIASDKDIEGSLYFEKGLIPAGGANATKDEFTTRLFIPSPFNLLVNNIEASHDGISGSVSIQTSQPIRTENLSSFIRIRPEVKFQVSAGENGLEITSDQFDITKLYTIQINEGLRGSIGGVLREEYSNNIAFGEMEPAVSFVNSKAVYLSAMGNENIEMRIVNVPRVKIIVSKIYESNLLAALRYGYYPTDKSTASENEYYYEDDYANPANISFGDVIYESEIDTRTLPKYGNSRLLKFNIEDRISDFKGIYHIKIRSTENYWVSDSRFISKTDIGLIAKEGSDKIIVFANSIKTADPIAGLNMVAYGINNQVLGMSATDENGVAEISYARKEFAGFKPAMILARSENDFNYLPFNSTAVNTSRFEVSGKRLNSTGLDAFVYEERDIYRPGETIHFSVIVRDRNWKAPGDLPVKLRFLLPNGKELKNFRKNLNSEGSMESEITISNSAITGSYTLEVYSSNNILLASKVYNVEEFVPDRIQVKASLSQPVLAPGVKTTLNVNARNFFGPPAAGRKYEAEIQVRPKQFKSARYPRYDFTLMNQSLSFDKVLREGQTDENGEASEQYEVPQMFSGIGILQSTFYATVFDETGRPVSRSVQADIFTQESFIGLADDGYHYHALNQPIKFALLALNRKQAPVSTRADVKVIKHEYRTVLQQNGAYFRYDSQKDDKIVAEQSVNIVGENFSYSFTPRTAGDYELRVSLPGSNSYISRQFYSYGSWGTASSSFEVNTEGSIEIELDKTVYKPNESARILFKTPFSGRMLVTLESDRLLTYQYVDVAERSASLDIQLKEEYLPNVYVSATLIKPHQPGSIPLTVANGFERIRIEAASRRLPVKISALRSVRSNTKQKIKVLTNPDAIVTLAAVDNGILQVSDFKTPDPFGYFYASRALEVGSYNLYPLLFPEIHARVSSTGGDASMEMDKRVNPMPAERFKLVSFWSGIKKANPRGEVEFEMDVPSFSGEIRLMAIAYKGAAFGNAELPMTVADPFVISSALPRFLSPGDTINVPVTISNTTKKSSNVVVGISAGGPLSAIGQIKLSETIESASEKSFLFRVAANNTIGVNTVKIVVNAGGESFVNETEMSIRPASPLQFVTGSGLVKGGANLNLKIPNSGFLPGTSTYQLVVGKNPAIDLGKQLKFLLQYPYGCTEQTISAAFPQLYFSDLSALANQRNENAANVNANANVQEAIRKIKLRQLYNGALTLWDGEGVEHWWSTVYAAHFLLEAKKAGFDVDNSMLTGLLGYLNNRLKRKETIQYYYNRDQNKKIAPKEVAYSLYVLALASQANVPVMNYYKANPAILSLDSKYLLSVSYAVAGDKTRFKELLPSSFSGELSVPQTGGSFYSDIRDEAISLNALLDADPTNPQIPIMAKHVSDKLKQRSWYSTQECSFSFLALGKIARASTLATIRGEVWANGKRIKTVDGNMTKLTAKELSSPNLEIKTQGNGNLYYYWQSEGISVDGSYNEEDNYLKVRRTFFDRKGNEISGQQFKQNDLVIVRLSLGKTYSGLIENIVLTDILPAGFEIENPRTKEIPGMDWIKNASTPLSLDVRDDRINFFVDLSSPVQYYYYAVRAVSKGKFKMGPVSADAMYNGEYHSYHGGGQVVIE